MLKKPGDKRRQEHNARVLEMFKNDRLPLPGNVDANKTFSRPKQMKKAHKAYPMRLIMAVDNVPKKAYKFIDFNILHTHTVEDVLREIDAVVALFLAKYPTAGSIHVWLWDFERDEIVAKQGYRTRMGFVQFLQDILRKGMP